MSHLLEYIKQLSESDTKTLPEKALKGTEEMGELAKKILPYSNSFATNHRFVTSESILEELADIYLVIKSVQFDLGFNEDEFEEVVLEKAAKWQQLQANEENLEYPIPYEIHITVSTDDIDSFKESCKIADVKPIVIDLQEKTGGTIMQDVMTSSVFFGNNREAYEELKRISAILQRDHTVIREKIETVPWHPAAPQDSSESMPEDCYFETHFRVQCIEEDLEDLRQIAESFDAHLSRNAFKVSDNGMLTQMITYRNYDIPRDEYEFVVARLAEDLEIDYELEKVITEFSIYDTKVSHDFKWTE